MDKLIKFLGDLMRILGLRKEEKKKEDNGEGKTDILFNNQLLKDLNFNEQEESKSDENLGSGDRPKVNELDFFVFRPKVEEEKENEEQKEDQEGRPEEGNEDFRENQVQPSEKINYWVEALTKSVFVQSDHQIDFKGYGIKAVS